MKVRAFAKINLTLDVTGVREDGYHLLDTVMQSVSLWDELEVEPGGEDIRLLCSQRYLPVDRKNTVYRAAELFFQRCGISGAGLTVSIRKRIPSRAGLGGGSADAAAVLCALNELYRGGLNREELQSLGAEIGADVPFCITGGTARCTGIGETVEPVAPMPGCELVLCRPPAGVSTPRAYALLDSYPLTRERHTPDLLEALRAGSLRRVAGALGNRFDETLQLTQVREIRKQMLSAGALGAMMTGSGSAVFGIFEGKKAADDCARLLRDRGRVYRAHPVRSGISFSGKN